MRRIIFQVRLTAEQKAQYQQRCTESGLTESDYFRVKCLDESPLRALRKLDLDRQTLVLTIAELKAIGNNLNQLTKKFHTLGMLNHSEVKEVEETSIMIQQLLIMIRQILGYDLKRSADDSKRLSH